MNKERLLHTASSISSSDESDLFNNSGRFSLDQLNDSFRNSVPSLKYLDWSISKVSRGYCETVLPHNVSSTNQYVAHQAALQLVAADYTGGIALCTLFEDTPVIGFDHMRTDYGLYVWGGKANIKWFYPSCDDLICKATVPEKEWGLLRRRLADGNRIVIKVPIHLFNKDRLVSKAELTYWVQDTHGLRNKKVSANKVHFLHDFKYKSMSKLVAGLRAMEQEKPVDKRLFDDSYAFMAAQNYGLTMAKRYCQHAPELQTMVAARTRHLDDLIMSLDEGWQVIQIGVGLDCRPWRLQAGKQTYFELDEEPVIAERESLLPDLANAQGEVHRIAVDLKQDDLAAMLMEHPQYDSSKPSLVIWEGCSMYANAQESDRIFNSVSRLMTDPRSICWFDYVSDAFVSNTSNIPSIENFVRTIRRMGEPYVTGYQYITQMLEKHNMVVMEHQVASKCLDEDDRFYDHYYFCIAQQSI